MALALAGFFEAFLPTRQQLDFIETRNYDSFCDSTQRVDVLCYREPVQVKKIKSCCVHSFGSDDINRYRINCCQQIRKQFFAEKIRLVKQTIRKGLL